MSATALVSAPAGPREGTLPHRSHRNQAVGARVDDAPASAPAARRAILQVA